MDTIHFGVIDNRFLSRSVGLLNPPTPICLPLTATVKDGLTMLKEKPIGCILLTDPGGKLGGIFTERDVVKKMVLSQVPPTAALSEYITKDPQTIEMTTPIAFVLQMMSEGGFRHVPIIDDGGFPVGIVSIKDIVDYVVRSIRQDLHPLGAQD